VGRDDREDVAGEEEGRGVISRAPLAALRRKYATFVALPLYADWKQTLYDMYRL
jgi:hypothetical protein